MKNFLRIIHGLHSVFPIEIRSDHIRIFLIQNRAAYHHPAVRLLPAQQADRLFHAGYGGGHQSAQTHQRNVAVSSRTHDGLRRHVPPQVDDIVAVILQQDVGTGAQFGFGKQIILDKPEVELENSDIEDNRYFDVNISTNVQFAIKGAVTENPLVYVLEVNPRASRTVPFVSKATGEPLAKIAARCMVGKTFAEQGAKVEVTPSRICVKEAVFPFAKFLGVDPVLGPEMRSTGEVMGVGKTFGEALFKSQLGSGSILPPAGTVFISVRDEDKPRAIVVASELLDKGYSLVATRGTAAALAKAGIPCKVVNKVSEGRPSVIDKIKNHEIQLVITTSNESRGEISDARDIRMAALANRVTYYTTIAGGRAAVEGIKHLTDAQVCSLQEMYAEAAKA